MSLPNVPDFTPDINISKKKALNLLLVSIAMEEIGLSHIVNAEGEKLQAVLEKFNDDCEGLCIHDLLLTNKSIRRTLRDVVKKELILQFKLEDVIELYQTEGFEDDDK